MDSLKFDRRVFVRLMSDAKQERWYGNPFKYILQTWETRGKSLVDAAAETFNTTMVLTDIESAKATYDIWINVISSSVSKRHGEIGLNPDDFFMILETVDIMLTVGLEERTIKNAYYDEAFKLQELGTIGQSAFNQVLSIMHAHAVDLKNEHEQSLDQLHDGQVHDVK